MAAALLIGAGLAAVRPVASQDEPESPAEDPSLRSDRRDSEGLGGMTLDELREDLHADHPGRIVVDPRSGDVRTLVHGNVDWGIRFRGEPARLRCDRLVVNVPGALRRGDESPGEAEVSNADPERVEFWFYADGNVWLRLIDQRTVIEAESVYYERRAGGAQLCWIRRARMVTTVAGAQRFARAAEVRDLRGTEFRRRRGRGIDDLPIAISADSLLTHDFASFSGENLRASTCDFAVPHYALSAPAALVTPVPGGGNDLRIDFDDARLELDGERAVGLPLDHWDTRWHDWLPIRDVHLGNSGKYGTFGSVDWNLNFFLEWTPLGRAPFVGDLLQRSRLDYETTYFSARGFGHGPKGEYGLHPLDWQPLAEEGDHEWYGEARYFAIHDSGRDLTSRQQFSDRDRWWGNVNHRHKIPYLGLIDVEYSELSDQNFLREYFESIDKVEKEQENLFLWRRHIGDNFALSGLYKYQGNEFRSEVERLPEARVQLLEQQVLGTGLYTDLSAAAAYIRRAPASGSLDPEREFGRFDLGSEWAYPLRWTHPWVDIRPFFMARLSAYSELDDPAAGSEDRLALGSGVTVSQQWSRTFDTGETVLDRWFGIEKLKHVVVPRATYLNRFSNDLSPTELIGVDGVDTVDLEETVALSLRQALLTRSEVDTAGRRERPLLSSGDAWLDVREYRTRTVVDSDASIVFFPREERDNSGSLTSLLLLDNTLHPGDWISLRAWMAVDIADGFRFDSTDVSTTVDVVPDVLSLTVGDRFTRWPGHPRGDANFIYSLATLELGERWRVQGFVSQDIDSGRNSEISLAVARVFHRFAMVLEYSVDPGEDYDQTISVNVAPASMLRDLKRGFLR